MPPNEDRIPEGIRAVIIDDQPANVSLLETIISQERRVSVQSTCNSLDAVELVTGFKPDIVFLDLMMPHLDGFGVMCELKGHIAKEGYLPILVLTADSTPETMRRALAAGATDFLTKPFDPVEVVLRMRNLLHTRELYQALQQHNESLETMVLERTDRLEKAKLEILDKLARSTEYRDYATGEHTRRVGLNASRIWSELGMPSELTTTIEYAAPLHDVGKVGIPDKILLKPGRLTSEEFDIVKQHTVIGARILAGSQFATLRMAETIARHHHERWDGGGYPDGLSGEDIPLEARIVCVCDVFDALTNERPYKEAWPPEAAVKEISKTSGYHLDPTIAAAFVKLWRAGRIAS